MFKYMTPDEFRRSGKTPFRIYMPAIVCALAGLLGILVIVAFSGYPQDPSAKLVNVEGLKPEFATILLQERIDTYKQTLSEFDTNIKLQALLVVIVLLLIIRRTDSLDIFGNKIPLSWLHAFVPCVILFLWLDFGFMFDDLIEGRVRGVQLATGVNGSPDAISKSLFCDAGIIDGWFMTYIDRPEMNISGIDNNSPGSSAMFLMTLFGTLMAASHAALLSIVAIGYRRYLRTSNEAWVIWYCVLPLAPMLFLILSHRQFAYGGSNPNTLYIYIAAMTIVLMSLLLWRSSRTDASIDPESVYSSTTSRTLIHPTPITSTSEAAQFSMRHIALIGDSLSTGFHVGHRVEMVFRSWFPSLRNWFMDKPGSPVRSVFQRLDRLAPMASVHHGAVAAVVNAAPERSYLERLLRRRHFSHQVDCVLRAAFPDALLIWIGHNNVDWRLHAEVLTDGVTAELTLNFVIDYERQLARLLSRARAAEKPVLIFVFGLVNFEAFFRARAACELQQAGNPQIFPYLRKDYDFFQSMRPEYRDGMIRLARSYNTALQSMCQRLAHEQSPSLVRLLYSDALSTLDISDAAKLHRADAWHPSVAGHEAIAHAVFSVLCERMHHVGWPSVAPGRAIRAANIE